MKKYIYPAGITGHYLAWLMQFLYGDVEIEFIDDGEDRTSLESFARKNFNKDVVVELALSRLADNYEDKLENMKQNLERLGIAYEDRSLQWHIQQVNEKVKKEFIGDEKAVVMICQRTGGNKHFGFLQEELLKRGVKVILVCSDMWVYEALREYNSKKCLVIYWLAAYMNYLNFGEVVLETSHFEFDLPNKNLILIGHALCNNTSYIHNYKQITATCVFDKRHIKESREEYIPSGYLGFDVMLDKINSTAGGGGK